MVMEWVSTVRGFSCQQVLPLWVAQSLLHSVTVRTPPHYGLFPRSPGLLQKSASARACKRPGPSPRVLPNGRRRDRGGQQAQGGVGTCSPATSNRRMSLGGNSVRVRDEFLGSPARMSTPTGGHHGRHGIRYQKSHSDTFLEEVKHEVGHMPSFFIPA